MEQVRDKRELYKTARIARTGKVFAEGEYVAVKVLHRCPDGVYVFTCRNGDRVDQYAEGFLKDFCL